jgi:transcription factor MYB, plant
LHCIINILATEFLWFRLLVILEHFYGRYLNSLDPSLKWSEWTKEEDSRLEAAITKYGCCWSKVAEDVTPRTDCQCRKYASSINFFDENICFKNLSVLSCYPYLYMFVSLVRRWMVLHPEQALLLKEAKKKQRSQLSRNFVDRESERPVLPVNDLIPSQMVVPPSDVGAENLRRKRKRKSRYILFLFKFLFH